MTPPRQRASASPQPEPTPTDSPSSSPPQDRPSPLFLPPDPTIPEPTPTPAPEEVVGAGPAVADEMPALAEPSSSAPRSTIDRKAVRRATLAAVRAITTQLNRALPRDEVEQAAGLWLADEEDEQGIAEPMANMAIRRDPAGAIANPDLLDIVALGIAVASYVTKQLHTRRELRALKQAGRVYLDEGGGVVVTPAPKQEQEPAA